MQIIKHYSHKRGFELIEAHHLPLLHEIRDAVIQVNAVDCLTKLSKEKSRIRKYGGLIFSPRTINYRLKSLLYPLGWAIWSEKKQKYGEPGLFFPDETTAKGSDRFRKMDGIKDRVGLEIQLGKYAFMGYDIFSKMIIFRNKGLIDYGIEIVLVQEMVNRMSTGVSAFEHLMIDFEHRGEADIDVPVLVLGIGPSDAEWNDIQLVQQLYRDDPDTALIRYPNIGLSDLKGTKPGPK